MATKKGFDAVLIISETPMPSAVSASASAPAVLADGEAQPVMPNAIAVARTADDFQKRKLRRTAVGLFIESPIFDAAPPGTTLSGNLTIVSRGCQTDEASFFHVTHRTADFRYL
jgi:hypothetical protein